MSTSITTTSTSTSGRLRLRAERRGGRTVLAEAAGQIPYAARVAPGRPGWVRSVLVQTVAGPLAGDRTEVEIDVGPGAALEVGTNAATLAFPAEIPARHDVRIRLGAGSRLVWRPEPLILAAGCNLEARLQLELAEGAAALIREVVVLGRHGEGPGRYRSTLRCELGGRPLLHEAVDLDAAGLARASGAILAGARVVGSLALLGVEPGGATLRLEGPGAVHRALARDTAALAGALDPVEAVWRAELGEAS